MKHWIERLGLTLSQVAAKVARRRRRVWPHVPGKYFVLDPTASVAVSTLADTSLAESLRDAQPAGLCIVGKTVTENVGVDKVVRNIVSNPVIRYLLLAGPEAPRHLSGQTFLALHRNGIAPGGLVAGSPGRQPVIPNVVASELRAFREEVEIVDMIGCQDRHVICDRIESLARVARPCTRSAVVQVPPRVQAAASREVRLDPAGYFVITPADGVILVEHFDYRHQLLRTIEGREARALYLTIVENGWISTLDHAAYLGRELARAEVSLRTGGDYQQDGA